MIKLGDCLDCLMEMEDECVDLIYIDPPYYSQAEYKGDAGSFSDKWKNLDEYINWMFLRLKEMKRVLKKTGTIYVHCDWHASHYLKVNLDKIFGYDSFLNEVIWHYESGGRATNFFSRKHDSLLWYRKTKNYYFNGGSVSVPRNLCPSCGTTLEKWNNLKKQVDSDGRVFRSIKSAGKIYTYYDDEPVTPPNVWIDISHIQQKDPQRLGYPTQKPERLLERIILSSCPENGIVADFFCGSGTTAAVAKKTGRRWITCDESQDAIDLAEKRILSIK